MLLINDFGYKRQGFNFIANKNYLTIQMQYSKIKIISRVPASVTGMTVKNKPPCNTSEHSDAL